MRMNIVLMYRHHVVRSVLGTHPAMLAKEANPVALNCICQRLADADEAMHLLWRKGYGSNGSSLADIARGLPILEKKR